MLLGKEILPVAQSGVVLLTASSDRVHGMAGGLLPYRVSDGPMNKSCQVPP